MWRNYLRFATAFALMTSMLFAAGGAVGEHSSALNDVKVKLEQGRDLTAMEKSLAESEGLFDVAPLNQHPAVVRDVRTALISESFEGTFPPAGWTTQTTDTGGDGWGQDDGSTHGPGTVADGSYAAMADIYNMSSGTYANLTSPSVDLSTLSAPELRFYAQVMTGSGIQPNLMVNITTDGGANWDTLYNQDADGSLDTWTQVTLDLSAYATATAAAFDFVATSDWGYYNLFVDYVTVDDAPTDPIISLSATDLDFGTVPVGIGAALGLQIDNIGGADLTIVDIDFDGPGFYASDTAGVVVPGGAFNTIISFSPADTGDYNNNLIITSDAASSPDTVTLYGYGQEYITSGGPDLEGYTWSNNFDAAGPTYAWIDTVGATDLGISNGDDYRGTATLPFTLYYYGNFYNELTVTTNAWIGMGPYTNYTSSYWTNDNIPNPIDPNNVIAPLWDDFKAGNGSGSTSSYQGIILEKTVGTAPNRQYVIIFSDLPRSYGDTDGFTFEVIFDEATSNITFQYQDVTGNTSANNGTGATIGLENAYGDDGLEVSYNGDPQLIYDGMAIEFIAPPPPMNTPFFSEYIEGSGNNKALEIYNGTGGPINLDEYQIAQSVNGGGWQYYHTFPAGSVLEHGDVWVITTDAALPEMQAVADEVLSYPSVVHHNGDDARALIHITTGPARDDTTWLDLIGDPDNDPGSGWDVAGITAATANHTLMRKPEVDTGNMDWLASAGTNTDDSEWMVFDQDYWYGLGYTSDSWPEPGDDCTLPLEAVEGINVGAVAPIWYEYTAPFDGSMNITSDINGQTSDTKVYVYDDCEGSYLDYDDDGGAGLTSNLDMEIFAGVTYYIFWSDQWSSAMFDWQLTATQGMPDFIVSAMEYTAEETLSVEVTNQGEADSPGWFGTDYHGLYIDGDYLGYVFEDGVALLAGESYTYVLTGVNYDNLGAGPHQIVFEADTDNDVDESDETNNVDTLDINISVPPAVPRHLMAMATPGQVNLTWEPAPEESLPLAPLAYNGLSDQRSKPVENDPLVLAKWEQAASNGWRDIAIYGDDCSDPFIVSALPFVDTSSTAGFNNSFTYGNGNDVVYQVTVADSGYLYANTCAGTSGDTKLEIYDATCATALDQNDDACGLRSEVMAAVGPGTYHVVVDGYSSGDVDYIVEIFWTPDLIAPDLAVTEMWYDGEVVWGVVTNVGSAPETSGQSTHWYVDGTDVGYEYTDPLDVGESDTLGLGGLEYGNVGPGEFYVELEADYWDNLDEPNEDNNIMGITVIVEPPDYVPAYNVYRDGIMIAGPIDPIDFQFNGGYVDWGLAIGDYCYEVTQILPDDTESGFSNEACASVVPGTPVGLNLAVNPDASATLNWAPPLPTGEVRADDGSAERWFWVGSPSSVDHQMAQGLQAPVPSATITHIALFGLGDEPAGFENVIVYGATADGMPDMTNILATVPGVAFNATWDTGPEWVLFPVDVALPAAEFFISVQWPDGSEVGPFVGTDDDTYTEHAFWTNDAGTTWNMFNSVFMFRAFLQVGGELVVVGPQGPVDEAISTPANPAITGTSVDAPAFGWIPDDAHRDFLGTFNVYRGEEPGVYTDTLAEDLADVTLTDLPDVFDIPYFYVVTANYDEGMSPPSNEVSYVPMAVPWLDLDVPPDFGVDLAFGDVFGTDTFFLGNLGLDTLDFEISYEVPMGRIVSRSIEGSYIYSMDLPPAPGTTADLDLYVLNNSTDSEWLDSISVEWPTGITVNSSTDFVVVDNAAHYLATNGATGDGATNEWINHDGGYGNIWGGEVAMATVNVTVDAGYTDDVYFDYYILGDIWGADPHEVWGSFVFEIPAFAVTLEPEIGFLESGTGVDVAVNVDVLEYQDGFYPGAIHIVHNDERLPEIFFPFDVSLAPAMGGVAGTVTSSYDNAPIEGATIEFASDDGPRDSFFATTGPDGSYDIEIPVGDYYAYAWHGDYFDVDAGMITVNMDAVTALDLVMDPDVMAPADVQAYEDGGVYVSWMLPMLEIPLWLDDGEGSSGFYQNFGSGYGSVYDLTPFGGASIEYTDFLHYGWGVTGLFDYYIHIVDAGTDPWTEVAVLGPFTTSADASADPVLEEGLDLGGIEGLDYVGIFIEPLSGTADDAYPDLMTDATPADPGNSFILDLATMEPWDISESTWGAGEFVQTLWVIPNNGPLTSVEPAQVTSAVNLDAASRGTITGWEGIGIPQQEEATRAEMLNFNVYRAVDFGAFDLLGTTDPDVMEYLDTDVVPNTHYSYAVSAMYDVAESALSDTAEIDFVNVDELGLPTEFALHQNYPNPFNPITSVRYDLPEASDVKLTVYNILGQKIVTLVDAVEEAGYHSVTWTGLDVAGQPVSSGIYMYRMETNGFTDVKKMMFLK